MRSVHSNFSALADTPHGNLTTATAMVTSCVLRMVRCEAPARTKVGTASATRLTKISAYAFSFNTFRIVTRNAYTASPCTIVLRSRVTRRREKSMVALTDGSNRSPMQFTSVGQLSVSNVIDCHGKGPLPRLAPRSIRRSSQKPSVSLYDGLTTGERLNAGYASTNCAVHP